MKEKAACANITFKLTEDQVKEIFCLFKAGDSQQEIAERFGISFQHVSAILLRKRWKHVVIEDQKMCLAMDEIAAIYKERNGLVLKQFTAGLTSFECDRLEFLRQKLDIIESIDADKQLDFLAEMAEIQERLVNKVRRLLEVMKNET